MIDPMDDSLLDERIRAMRCWRGAISLEPLSGGITNRNLIARDRDERYVVRVCEDRSFLGIDRRNERLCQQAAASIGISPEVTHAEDVFLVSRFVEESRTLAAGDVTDASMLARIAAVLRELHDARHRLVGELLYFCPFQTVRTYTATARGLNAPLPVDIDDLLADSAELGGRMRPFQPALCHNDLLPANFLDTGARIWIVDWEYGGVGNPLFDLASVSANARLSTEMEVALLESYGLVAEDVTRRELQALKTVSLLREALWAVIQVVKSELDFDYRQYAADNFAAYRAARAALA
jgi:thiamine kinase-like enzyme